VVLAGHPSLEQAQVVGERVKAAVAAPFSIAHSTLELECEPCADGGQGPCGMHAGRSA
jgi:cobalt-zinc-cadmium efflux system protein